jgi:hypothetical protein
MTEAEIFGKIGMNSKELGICTNAIQCSAKGLGKLPVSMVIRRLPEYAARSDEAVTLLDDLGASTAVIFLT